MLLSIKISLASSNGHRTYFRLLNNIIMKTNSLLVVASFMVFTILFSACGVKKKYMNNAFDMIKTSFPGAKTKIVNNKIQVLFPNNDMFDVGSSDLKPKFDARVTKFAEIMNKFPDTKLNLTGHTDNTGKHDSNIKLSLDRAQHVKDAFVSHSVTAARIAAYGLGETAPIADNSTDAGKAENRRVAFEMYYAK